MLDDLISNLPLQDLEAEKLPEVTLTITMEKVKNIENIEIEEKLSTSFENVMKLSDEKNMTIFDLAALCVFDVY